MPEKDKYTPQQIEPKWQAALGRRRAVPLEGRLEPPQVLRADHAALSQRRSAHRPLVRHDAVGRARPLSCACRATTCCSRWASTPSACPPKTPPSSAASTPRRGRTRTSSNMRTADCARWARCSTGSARPSAAIPSTTSGRSGSSCKFYKNGLAYRQYVGGGLLPALQHDAGPRAGWGEDRHCERCGTPVIKKDLEQWFFRITNYADELLDHSQHRLAGARQDHADQLDRPQRRRACDLQDRSRATRSTVFTTRPDTLWGATFMVLAPEHPLVEKITTAEQRAAVEAYVARGRAQDRDRAHGRG